MEHWLSKISSFFKINFGRFNRCVASVRNCKPLCSAKIAELYNDKLANLRKRIREKSLEA